MLLGFGLTGWAMRRRRRKGRADLIHEAGALRRSRLRGTCNGRSGRLVEPDDRATRIRRGPARRIARLGRQGPHLPDEGAGLSGACRRRDRPRHPIHPRCTQAHALRRFRLERPQRSEGTGLGAGRPEVADHVRLPQRPRDRHGRDPLRRRGEGNAGRRLSRHSPRSRTTSLQPTTTPRCPTRCA